MDTAAALLALYKHAREPLQILDCSPHELAGRIAKGARSLCAQLAICADVETSNHIGVELVLPALLDYLEAEDPSLRFTFDERHRLEHMSAAKLSIFCLEMLYERRPCSALHSLEALIGKVDFDRLSHHLVCFNGSMMASPSSTAAYLMQTSKWNEEAEAYLQHVIVAGAGHGNGGVPGTFPTHHFEYSWLTATLLKAGFDRINNASLGAIGETLQKAFAQDGGITGFGKAPEYSQINDITDFSAPVCSSPS